MQVWCMCTASSSILVSQPGGGGGTAAAHGGGCWQQHVGVPQGRVSNCAPVCPANRNRLRARWILFLYMHLGVPTKSRMLRPVSAAVAVCAAVPVGPGRCRLLNRNTFKFNKGGIGSAIARAVMKLAPDWAIHMGTQVHSTDSGMLLMHHR